MGIASGKIPSGVVDLDSTQTLENKAIINVDKLEVKKVADADVANYLTSAENGEYFYNTDTKKYFQVVDNAAVEIIDAERVQTLTNKSIKDVEVIEAKKGTTSELETHAATAGDGELLFDTVDKKFFGVANNELVGIGGAGVGGADIYYFFNLEDYGKTDDWGRVGTGIDILEETTSPLNGKKSLKFDFNTEVAVDDQVFTWIKPNGRCKDSLMHKLSFVNKYTGVKGQVELQLLDESGNVFFSTELDPTVSKFSALIPNKYADNTMIKFKFIVKDTTDLIGKSLIIDDIEASDEAYGYGSATISETITYKGFTDRDGDGRVKLSTKHSTSSTGLLLSDEMSTNRYIKVVKDCLVTIRGNGYANTDGDVGFQIRESDNSTMILAAYTFSNYSRGGSGQTVEVKAGNVINMYSAQDLNDAYYVNFSVTATAQSDKILFEDEREQAHFVGKAVYVLNSQYSTTSSSYVLPSFDLISSEFSGRIVQNTPNSPSLTIPNAKIGTYVVNVTGDEMFNSGSFGTAALFDGVNYSSEQAHAQTYVGGFTLIYELSSSKDLNIDLMVKTTSNFYFGTEVPLELSVTYLPPSSQASTPTVLAVNASEENDYDVDASDAGVLSNFNPVEWCSFVSKITGRYTYELNTDIFKVFPRITAITSDRGATVSVKYLTFPQFLITTYNSGDVDVDHTISAKKRGADRSPAKAYCVDGKQVVKEQVMIVKDIKPHGTNGGQGVADQFNIRDLNTVDGDIFGSLSNNIITLPAGKYHINGYCPSYDAVKYEKACVFDSDTDTIIIEGDSNYGYTGDTVKCMFDGIIEKTTTVNIDVRHIIDVANSSLDFGISNSYGNHNVYTTIIIRKLL